MQQAQNVHIRKLLVKVRCCCGTIQNHRMQVITCSSFQTFNELFQPRFDPVTFLRFHGLPASARSSTAGTTSPKTSEASAASEASTPSCATAPTTAIAASPSPSAEEPSQKHPSTDTGE